DIGLVMIVGIIFAVIIWFLAGVLIAPRLGVRFELPVPTILDSDKSESGFESSPRVGTIAALLLLPLVLILLNTGLNTIGNTRPDPEAFLADAWVAGLRMIGETPIALLITVVVSMFVLGWGAGKEGSLIEKVTDSAIGPIASVVLITGAGGMFGGVLRVTGIGDAVAGSLNDIGMPVIVAAYLIAQIVRLAQGSATVALTTAASLMVGVIAASDVSQLQIVAIVMAMSAGAVGFSHVNDSGFWLVSRFFGMDMKQTLATWTVIQGAMALLGFVLSLALFGLAAVLGRSARAATPPGCDGRCGPRLGAGPVAAGVGPSRARVMLPLRPRPQQPLGRTPHPPRVHHGRDRQAQQPDHEGDRHRPGGGDVRGDTQAPGGHQRHQQHRLQQIEGQRPLADRTQRARQRTGGAARGRAVRPGGDAIGELRGGQGRGFRLHGARDRGRFRLRGTCHRCRARVSR